MRDGERAGARIRERPRLDGLLIERRTRVAGAAARGRREAEVIAQRLGGDQPPQEPQALVHGAVVADRAAAGDQRLGQQRVPVREPGFRPRPGLVVRAARQRGEPVVHERPRGCAPGVGGGELGRADHRVCGRARMHRAERRHELEQPAGLAADVRPRRARRGDADAEDRSAAGIIGGRVVRPSPVEPHAQPEPAVAVVRLHQEREPTFRELLGGRVVGPHGDRQTAAGIVGAVAERPMGQRADRMLEQARVVRHALQVSERGLRQGHAAASRSANTRCASRRYS